MCARCCKCAFNGKIGDHTDDIIDSYVASVKAQPLEGLTLGISYISNLASSDSFSEEIVTEPIDQLVDGVSAFVTFEFLDRFNHRLISLFFRAWEKYRYAMAYERDSRRGPGTFERGLFALLGLDAAGLKADAHCDLRSLLARAHAMRGRAASAQAWNSTGSEARQAEPGELDTAAVQSIGLSFQKTSPGRHAGISASLAPSQSLSFPSLQEERKLRSSVAPG